MRQIILGLVLAAAFFAMAGEATAHGPYYGRGYYRGYYGPPVVRYYPPPVAVGIYPGPAVLPGPPVYPAPFYPAPVYGYPYRAGFGYARPGLSVGIGF